MDIRVTHSALQSTAQDIPDFPLVRFDSGKVVYQEALVGGQYLVVNMSAMGRPKPHEWVWNSYNGHADSIRPLRTRQHAFQLEVDGQLLVDRWEWVNSQEVVSSRPGCRELETTLRHTQRPIQVAIHTRIDDTGFLIRWLVITNTGERPVALAQVFPWSGQVWEEVGHFWTGSELSALAGSPFRLGRFANSDAGGEGAFDWMDLPDGSYGFESMNGRSGWGAPFFIACNVLTGEAMVAQFGWSGNWQIDFYNDHEPVRRDARLYARIGMAGPAPLRVLESGESARTPEVHLGFLIGNLDNCAQALHAHERQSVLLANPAGREYLLEVNHTGYTRNAQVTEAQLHEDIDVAADAGVELFMLDAGWFGEVSANWYEAVGDWDRESPLIPGGVKAVFDYAHSRGMLCGLWVEVERMGRTSQVLKDHPDWQMEKRGQKIANYDLSRPEPARRVEEIILGAIEKYNLDCFRIDYNVNIGEGGEAQRGGYTENILWRHYETLYTIFDRVHARYPNLILENCSSGGGRNDLGMVSRFHFTQITDKWSPGPQVKILNGMTLALPPEWCEVHVGAISDGVADVDFMLRIGLFSHLDVTGIYPTMAERQMVARERWLHTLHLYKTVARAILPTGRLFHHTPLQRQTELGDWVVLEVASPDGSRSYAGIFHLAGASSDSYHFYPRGLDPARRYRVTYDNTGRTREIDGGTLLDQGLRVLAPGVFTSELLLFEAI
jgi:alpha-galactosidase